MILEAINHIPKSNMAYAINQENLHILLQTAKNDVSSVKLIIGDPFEWYYKDGKYVWSGESLVHQEMAKKYSTDLFDYYFIEVKTINLRSKYSFLLSSGEKEYFYGCRDLVEITTYNRHKYISNLFGYFNYPYINEGDLIDSPAWVKDVVWYQIFPDRFSRDNDDLNLQLEQEYQTTEKPNQYFYGGTLKGITRRIPYLKNLGITGIYFTPIFKSVSSHKYDISDYYEIDEAFGTKEDLKEMILLCHQNGIRVMLDAVFNHCAWNHPFFQDVVKNKSNSKYWDYFFIDNDDFINFELDEKGFPIYERQNIRPKFKTFAFTPMMPKWNTDNLEVEEYLLDVAKYWIEEFDIDGWRLDVSNEVSHRFWRAFKKAVREVKKDIYILGENWDDSNAWLRGDQMDAVMNYEIAYPIWQFFGSDPSLINIDSYTFSNRISKLLVSYQQNVSEVMFNLIGSHDTSRILVKCNNNLEVVKLAYLFLLSFSGSPAIYYGDEVGLGKDTDKDMRSPMIWDDRQNLDMHSFFQKLIQLRKEYRAFRLVDLKWIIAKDQLLVYSKGNIVFILNNSSNLKEFVWPEEFIGKMSKNLFTNEVSKLDKNQIIQPYQYLVFEI